MTTSVIYYTSNQEEESFEKKVREQILRACGNIPIVSVSQKPIDFGKNICVGDVGVSEFNALRQILIACENTDTDYVICTEADCLYAPDYFAYQPMGKNVYRNTNTYIIGNKRDFYWKKNEGGLWSQIVNRYYYINRLRKLFDGEPEWDKTRKGFVKDKGEKLFDTMEYFETKNPSISFKRNGMRKFSHSDRTPIHVLPFWGYAKKLVETYK